jgi:hypothetical protein
MSKYSRLTGGAAAVAGLALMTGSAFAQTFVTGTITTYATQAVTTASGAITVPVAGMVFTTPLTTAVSTAGSFLITFTLPTGATFSITPSVTINGPLCTAAPNTVVTPSGGGNGAANAVFTIPIIAAAAIGSSCTVGVNAYTLAGATQLQSKTTSTSAAAGGFAMTEQVSASTGTAPTFNQVTALSSGIASSASALTVTSANVIPATINVLSPSNGTKITQGAPISTTNVAFADLGSLQTTLAVAANATATGQFTFSGSAANVTITGNLTGANNAYIAPAGTVTCATTFAGKPGGSFTGTIAGNSITFTNAAGTGLNVAANAGILVSQEVCIYYTGTTIIGQNPAAAPFVTSETVDTTTVGLSAATPLATETYNGVVFAVAYTGNFTVYPTFVRVVNGTAASIQVFAVVQGDSGSLGTTTVETGLAANNNDIVPVTTILTNSGVTLPASGRASITLLAPTGTIFSHMMQQPGGLIDNIF